MREFNSLNADLTPGFGQGMSREKHADRFLFHGERAGVRVARKRRNTLFLWSRGNGYVLG